MSVTFALKSIWQIGTLGMDIAVVSLVGTFVDWDGADVTVSNITGVAVTVVTGLGVLACCVWGAFVAAETFVNVWKACFTVAVVSGVAVALVAAGLFAIGGLLGGANGVGIAVVVA